MGLAPIVMIACFSLASSEPSGLLGGGIGGITDIDLGIIDPEVLLQQLLQQKALSLSNIQVQSEQLKQVNERLRAQMQFTAIDGGSPLQCVAQIYAYVVGQAAQILNQSVLNCNPVGGYPDLSDWVRNPTGTPQRPYGQRALRKTKRNTKHHHSD